MHKPDAEDAKTVSPTEPRGQRAPRRREFLATSAGAALAAAFPIFPESLWADPAQLQAALKRLRGMTMLPLTDWRYHAPDLAHGEDPQLDDSAWKAVKFSPFRRGRRRQVHGAGWYRARVAVPATIGGFDARSAALRFALGAGPLARVFFNGGLVAQGNSKSLTPVPFPPYHRGAAVQVTVQIVDQKGPGSGRFYGAGLMASYPKSAVDPGELREALGSAAILGKGFRQPRVTQAAQKAAATLDFNALPGNQPAFRQSLKEGQNRLLAARGWERTLLIRAVGNSHIDLAWLWPWTEAVEVVRDTFATVLELMREYPGFLYTQSSARDFAWLEHKYPPLFREIQNRVKEGRWEMVGGMWCEPDLNMPDGESLVRQLLVGKRYFQKKFGVDVRIGWNPDSFGYSWQLAQIYKRSGVNYFVTQKLLWNDTTPPPHTLFWWEAPDGSRVLTYFPHGYSNGTAPIEMARNFATFAPQKMMMHLYGVGDHGGGPTRQMLDQLERWKKPGAILPRLEYSTAQAFFDQVQPGAAALPAWKDEMYLQFHRGTYTSQAKLKLHMRRSEELLQNTEKFCALASALYGRRYPRARLEDGWKRVLFDQFHDVMAGSGIAVNYRDAAENLRTARALNEPEMYGAQQALAARVDTRGAGAPVMVFNPLSWARTDTVELEVELPRRAAGVELRDAAGHSWPAQALRRDAGGKRFRLLALAENVPAYGYRVVHAAPAETAAAPAATSAAPARSALRASRYELENEFFRLKINPQTGNLASVYDKRARNEVFAPGVYHGKTLPQAKKGHRHAWAAPLKPLPAEGNILQFFHDKAANWDAWNIEADYERHPLGPVTVEKIELVETGPARAAIRVTRKFRNSTFTQDLRVSPGVPRLDIYTRAQWHEQHVMLKAAFPLNVHADFASYEIPYGVIRRANNPQTPAEMAKWEVPAQRWGDLSQASHGCSLLNNCKYGYDAHGNVLRLTLLRSPTWPDPHADQGEQEFIYSLFPHAGGWLASGTMRQGWQLNYPLLALAESEHAGALPATYSFFSVEPANVILSAVKQAEDDTSLVLRLYEYGGHASRYRLRLPRSATHAAVANMMEHEEKTLALSNGGQTIEAPIGAYEIQTLKIRLARG